MVGDTYSSIALGSYIEAREDNSISKFILGLADTRIKHLNIGFRFP